MLPTLPLSLALAGLNGEGLGLGVRAGGGDRGAEVRGLVRWARTAGYRAVQIDASTPGVRARDLDRSGRRDLAATLRREGVGCSGLDLWIPPEHFLDPANSDRAVAGVLGAVDLAAELAALASGSVVSTRGSRPGCVSVLLPEGLPADVLAAVGDRARSRSVRVADHAWPVRAGAGGDEAIGVGLDPAAVLASGGDPAGAAVNAGGRVYSARLSDVSRGLAAGGRIAPGTAGGRLDVLAYTVALVTTGYAGHLVVDLRGVGDQAGGALAAVGAGTTG